ncbi:hypothetical protein ABBQ38_009439 [Trebouxia sp. C0009 RCD-2024]
MDMKEEVEELCKLHRSFRPGQAAAELAALSKSIRSKQRKAHFQGIDGTLIASLTHLLGEQQLGSYQAAVAGDVDHFQSEVKDTGWGCGWRNIQMVCSHLLRHDKEMAQALFHGCGFVPDLLSLQAWLECAWKGGFDTAGGDMLGNAAQHSDQWIGTTECAALLRFFGLKAQIIDFTGGLKNPNIQTNKDGEEVHMGVACDGCGVCPIVGPRYNSQVVINHDLCDQCHALPDSDSVAPFRRVQNQSAPHSKSGVTTDPKLADRNQQGTLPHLRLMEWVWNYFVDSSTESDTQHDKSSTRAGAVHAQPSKQDSGSSHWRGQEEDQSRKQQRTDGHKQQTAPSSSPSPSSRHVIIKTGKPPLYFQHEGHSRTIIGIERYKPTQGRAKRQADSNATSGNEGYLYNLLLLDPSHKTKDLVAALKSGRGWQKLFKQGISDLKSQQYQLLYVDDGVLHGPELEDWKVLKATETY